MKPNTIPKSLHTVTVLVNVARFIASNGSHDGADPVGDALAALGYADTPDAYQLADKARAILAKEQTRSTAPVVTRSAAATVHA